MPSRLRSNFPPSVPILQALKEMLLGLNCTLSADVEREIVKAFSGVAPVALFSDVLISSNGALFTRRLAEHPKAEPRFTLAVIKPSTSLEYCTANSVLPS